MLERRINQPRVWNLYAHPWGSQRIHPALGSRGTTVDVLQNLTVGWNPAFDQTWFEFDKGRHAVVGYGSSDPIFYYDSDGEAWYSATGLTWWEVSLQRNWLWRLDCILPAESAHLPIFDAIFTRIRQQMTWFQVNQPLWVEMIGGQQCHSHATKDSLDSLDNWDEAAAAGWLWPSPIIRPFMVYRSQDFPGATTRWPGPVWNTWFVSCEKPWNRMSRVTFLHKRSEPGPAGKSTVSRC